MECFFFGFYAAAFGYALLVFIGWHAAMEDFFGGLKSQPRLLSKQSWNKSVLARNGLYGYERQSHGAPDPNGISLLQMWLGAGLELGNHTFAHTDLHATSVAAFKQDVIRGEAVTGQLLQQKGLRLRYFRHPYLHTGRDLATRPDVERFLVGRGYRVAPVTVDNEDYLFAAAYSGAAERGDDQMMRRVGAAYIRFTERVFEYSETLSVALFGREIKQVILLHANTLNADYFDELARMMKKRGYLFISLDEALRDEAYDSANTYTGAEGITWLGRWAVMRGVKNVDNVLDDFPEVPEFVVKAADGGT
jgi:peptidoglycan-N-acetylglucosamine deacetylase